MDENNNITKRSFLKMLVGTGEMLSVLSFSKSSFAEFDDVFDEKKSELLPMPIVQFGNYKISKLVIGSNPMEGTSHFSREMNKALLDYSTKENVLEALRLSEKNGINTWQLHGSPRHMNMLKMYREQGGKLHCIVSSSVSGESDKFLENIKLIMAVKPIAIYIWGEATDFYWRNGEIDKIKEQIKIIKDRGVLAGVCSHNHKVLEYIDEKDWGADFYMACFYHPRKKRLIDRKAPEYYGNDDREAMCRFIRQTDKFCLGFKILAASRNVKTPEDARNAFEYALKNIKKGDAIVVGMVYPNHIRDNTKYVKEIWHEIINK